MSNVSPFSGLVLGAAALVSSPALWSAFVEGTMPLHTGLTRYLIAVAVCWVAFSLFVALVVPAGSAGAPREPDAPGDT